MNLFVNNEKGTLLIKIIIGLAITTLLIYGMVGSILYVNSLFKTDSVEEVQYEDLAVANRDIEIIQEINHSEFKYIVQDGRAKLMGLSDEKLANVKDFKLVIPEEIQYGEEKYKVTEIVESAFKNTLREYDIRQVEIPETVENIGSEAFSGNKLEVLRVPSSVKTIGQAAFQDNNLMSVYLGESVQIIKKSAFAKNQITEINIPDSVKEIQEGSFEGNKIMKVSITDDVKLDDTAINGRFGDAYFFDLEKKGTYIREDEFLYSWKRIKPIK